MKEDQTQRKSDQQILDGGLAALRKPLASADVDMVRGFVSWAHVTMKPLQTWPSPGGDF